MPFLGLSLEGLPLQELFWLLLVCVAILGSIFGRRKNHKLCFKALELLQSPVSNLFGLQLRQVDALYHNVFRLYAEGNDALEGILVSLDFKRRQDPLNFVYMLMAPDQDLVTFDVIFEKPLQPYSVAVIAQEWYPNYLREQENELPTARPVENLGSEAVREWCMVCADCGAAARSLLADEVCELIEHMGDAFQELLVIDDSPFYKGRSAVRLVVKLSKVQELIGSGPLPRATLECPLDSDELKCLADAPRALVLAVRLLHMVVGRARKVSLAQQEKEKAQRLRRQRTADLAKRDEEDRKGFFDRFSESVKQAASYKGVRNVPGLTRGRR